MQTSQTKNYAYLFQLKRSCNSNVFVGQDMTCDRVIIWLQRELKTQALPPQLPPLRVADLALTFAFIRGAIHVLAFTLPFCIYIFLLPGGSLGPAAC